MPRSPEKMRMGGIACTFSLLDVIEVCFTFCLRSAAHSKNAIQVRRAIKHSILL